MVILDRDTKNKPMTKNPVVTLNIDDIALIEELQVRKKLDNKTINTYMNSYKNNADMPIVKVAKIYDGYVMVDGWHRLEAMKRLGYPQLEVEIVAYSMPEAKGCASTANVTHGLKINKGEVKKALGLYIKGGRHLKGKYGTIKPYRDIAKELGGIVCIFYHDSFKRGEYGR
ncbi:MAG: ParB N-terminal domain-containing protein [Syntrophorhabdaceae bacterium]|nr:ParB N-terminal domain-containing protein [Syntrophorhabdaceae bacterium]